MPHPNQRLEDLGLWPKWKLPTQDVRKLLIHLTQEGEPLLFIQDLGGGSLRASVTNSREAIGHSTRIDAARLIHDGYVEVDRQWTRKSLRSITAYRISALGREALAQMQAYDAMSELLSREVPRLLRIARETNGLPVQEGREEHGDLHPHLASS